MGLFNKKTDELLCPLLNGPCIKEKCMFWTKLVGNNPQTGQPIDEFDCAIKWLPLMLVENSQMTRQGSATVQDFRNDVHRVGQAIAEESVKRRELEERRLEIDERILEHSEKKLLEAPKKKSKK